MTDIRCSLNKLQNWWIVV